MQKHRSVRVALGAILGVLVAGLLMFAAQGTASASPVAHSAAPVAVHEAKPYPPKDPSSSPYPPQNSSSLYPPQSGNQGGGPGGSTNGSGSHGLSSTGFATLGAVVVALVLLAAGGLMLLAGRRRRT